ADRRGQRPRRADRLRGRPQGGRGEEDQGRAGREAEKGQEVAMKIDIVNNENATIGSVELSDDVFGGRVNKDLMWESVVHANAAERRGTHQTKNRANVQGSGKKPWRQKG